MGCDGGGSRSAGQPGGFGHGAPAGRWPPYRRVRAFGCNIPWNGLWRAITEPAERAVWAPGLRFDPAPEARFDIWFGDECEGPSHVSGQLSNYRPPHSVALGSISVELASAPGGSVVHFSDVLWFDGKRTSIDFANAVLAGWHRFLDTLEIWLDDGSRGAGLAGTGLCQGGCGGGRELL